MGVGPNTPLNTVIGAGNLLVDGVDVGATSGNGLFRVSQTRPNIPVNGVVAPLLGMDYTESEVAEMEFGLLEVTAAILGYLIPGTTATTVAATATGGGWTTTLAAATVLGQQTGIKVTAITSMAVGQYVNFGAGTAVRQLTRVGTAGSGGTGVDVSDPLSAAYANGAAITQFVSDGGTQYTSNAQVARRVPTTANHTYEIRVPGLNGRRWVFGVRNALPVQPAEWTLADAAAAVPRMRVQARLDPAALTTSPWYITSIPADV